MQYEFGIECDGTGQLTLSHGIIARSYSIEYSRSNTDAFYGADGDFLYGPDGQPFYGEPTGWLSWPGSLQAIDGELIRFRVQTAGGSWVELIDSLTVNLDVPDINIVLNDVAVSIAGSRLSVPPGLIGIKNIQITVQADGNGGVTSRYADKTNTTQGPMAYVLNASGAPVAGLIDAVIQAY